MQSKFLCTMVLPNFDLDFIQLIFIRPISLLVCSYSLFVQRIVPEGMLQAGERRHVQEERPKHGREKHHYYQEV